MNRGKVYLVGAGPGNPGLITVKGLKCIESSQVIFMGVKKLPESYGI
jgi:siroheme synthase